MQRRPARDRSCDEGLLSRDLLNNRNASDVFFQEILELHIELARPRDLRPEELVVLV